MKHLCEKCHKEMVDTNFYTKKDGSKMDLCKKCLTMHINNFEAETFVWILEDLDVPYVISEWNLIRDKAFAKNPNLNGMSVIGKYLSKMKLIQWKNYGWEDSERANALTQEKLKAKEQERYAHETYLKGQRESGQISEAEYTTLMSTETLNADVAANVTPMAAPMFYDEKQFIPKPSEDSLDLTDEDKTYLAIKWGYMYTPTEWTYLEKKYHNMKQSFEIKDEDTEGSLILICKTDLKMNQAVDCGDVEGFQKLSKVSESLRKTARFTAQQNKELKLDVIDCVGEIVAMCERDGFIPRFATDVPRDSIDFCMQDMNSYVRKLVTEDLGFGQQIEDAIKKLEAERENNIEDELLTKEEYDEMLAESSLEDEDFEDFYKSNAEMRDADLQASIESMKDGV